MKHSERQWNYWDLLEVLVYLVWLGCAVYSVIKSRGSYYGTVSLFGSAFGAVFILSLIVFIILKRIDIKVQGDNPHVKRMNKKLIRIVISSGLGSVISLFFYFAF